MNIAKNSRLQDNDFIPRPYTRAVLPHPVTEWQLSSINRAARKITQIHRPAARTNMKMTKKEMLN